MESIASVNHENKWGKLWQGPFRRLRHDSRVLKERWRQLSSAWLMAVTSLGGDRRWACLRTTRRSPRLCALAARSDRPIERDLADGIGLGHGSPYDLAAGKPARLRQ